MCGIFGVIGNNKQNEEDIKKLANFAAIKLNGILFYNKEYKINKADLSIKELIKKIDYKNSELLKELEDLLLMMTIKFSHTQKVKNLYFS